MKQYILAFLTVMMIVLNPIKSNAYSNDSEYIKIKIGHTRNISETIPLNSSNGFIIYSDDINYEIASMDDTNLLVQFNQYGEVILSDSMGNNLETIPGDGSVIIGSENQFESIVKVGQNRYRDYITFLVKGQNVDIINYVHIENYLYGVVPREIPASSHIEALKSQALVARSYTYSNRNNHIKDGYNLCDTVHCQVYGGYDNEHAATNRAVDETVGEYITYNGEIISANYHSNSGGYTENSHDVWTANLPYLSAIEDRFSENAPNSTWSYSISAAELKSKLSASGINIGDIQGIEILEVSEGQRVKNVRIVGSSGYHTIKGIDFRNIIGASNLKSTWFSVNSGEIQSYSNTVYILDGYSSKPIETNLTNPFVIDGNSHIGVSRSAVKRSADSISNALNTNGYVSNPSQIVFNGRGFGHGVGMSQYGAMEMAKQGYSYVDIITHYYRGVNIEHSGK